MKISWNYTFEQLVMVDESACNWVMPETLVIIFAVDVNGEVYIMLQGITSNLILGQYFQVK